MSIKLSALVWQNYSGSRQELLTFLAFADRANDDGKSLFMSIKTVAKKIRLGEGQARRSIHKLINEDYIKVVKNHNGGRNKDVRHYEINTKLLHVPLYKGLQKIQPIVPPLN